MKIRFIIQFFIAIFGLYLVNNCFSQEIKLVKKIQIEEGSLLISGSFVLVDEGKFIFSDIKDEKSQLKIVDENGKVIKAWGRMGPGPDEFGGLAVIDYQNSYLAAMDAGKRCVHIFEKEPDYNFKKIGEFLAWEATNFIKLYDKTIIIGGYIISPKGKGYIIFERDFQGYKTEYLLPVEYRYGEGSEYQKTKEEVSGVSYSGYADIYEDFLFYVSDVRPKIIKVNLKNQKIEIIGKEPKNFRPLVMDKQIRSKLLNPKTGREVMKELLDKFSFVSGLFVDKDFIAVIYVNREKRIGNELYFVPYFCIYDWTGKVLSEGRIEHFYSEEKEIPLFYKKGAGELYMLSLVSNESSLIYTIYKFQVKI